VNVLSWILFGLVAGAVARLVVRGRQEIGCLATIAIGITGALIGGLIGEIVLDKRFASAGISHRFCSPWPAR
jgi:uncharacterized membrane protein YeaQ/YmgE (transglycosylase-associated protein family)